MVHHFKLKLLKHQKTYKQMKGVKIFLVAIILFSLTIISASDFGVTIGGDVGQSYGVSMEAPDTPSFNNNTGPVNDTTFWQGYTPTTFITYLEGFYCSIFGCTMQGDIDMNDNQILNAGNIISNDNITADTYFGDWNGGNVDRNINILRSDNPSLTLVLSYIGGIARIGTDGNDNFRFIQMR